MGQLPRTGSPTLVRMPRTGNKLMLKKWSAYLRPECYESSCLTTSRRIKSRYVNPVCSEKLKDEDRASEHYSASLIRASIIQSRSYLRASFSLAHTFDLCRCFTLDFDLIITSICEVRGKVNSVFAILSHAKVCKLILSSTEFGL
jgi:hypothetical protein